MNKDDVIDYLLSADNDTLVEMNNLIKDCFKKESSRLKYKLKAGDNVFIHGTPRFTTGVVTKVNRTRALVDCFCKKRQKTIHVHVPFSMITKNETEGA
jgi:hypothetical protein